MGIAAASRRHRMPGERVSNDFAFHHARYVLVPSFRLQLDEKLSHWRMQLRQRHNALARVSALDTEATLMQILMAATHRRRQRRPGRHWRCHHLEQRSPARAGRFRRDASGGPQCPAAAAAVE